MSRSARRVRRFRARAATSTVRCASCAQDVRRLWIACAQGRDRIVRGRERERAGAQAHASARARRRRRARDDGRAKVRAATRSLERDARAQQHDGVRVPRGVRPEDVGRATAARRRTGTRQRLDHSRRRGSRRRVDRRSRGSAAGTPGRAVRPSSSTPRSPARARPVERHRLVTSGQDVLASRTARRTGTAARAPRRAAREDERIGVAHR